MKEKLTNNIVLKIGAVLCAILLWLVAINMENPEQSDTRRGIPIQFINTNVFTDNGKTFQVESGVDTVSVRIYARRLDIDKITKNDFTAVVDCNKITEFNGAVKVEVTYTGDSSLLDSFEVLNDTIRIETEDMLTKTWTIDCKVTGSTKTGYTPGTPSLAPNQVEITAPESVMNGIASVGVTIDVEGADADVSKDVELTYYDAQGKAIILSASDRVSVSSSAVRVVVPVLKTNQVAVDYFDVKGTDAVAEGYRYIGVECDTPSVSLQGLKSAMAGLDQITIPSEELDVTGATGDIVKEIDITPYLPGNVEVVGSSVVTVTLKVEPLVTREFSVNKNWIQLNGLDEELYKYVLMPGNTTYRVEIQGLDEDLRTLSAGSLEIVLDLTGYEAGTHEVMPTMVLSEGFTVVTLKPIEVVITSLEEPETSEPETTEGSEEPSTEETEESSEETSEAETESGSGTTSGSRRLW